MGPYRVSNPLRLTVPAASQRNTQLRHNTFEQKDPIDKGLSPDDLHKMYRGTVEPHFSYCCSVWGCYSETKLNSLQKIQNRAARIITNSPYDASAAPPLQNLGWSSIKDLIRKETATLTYKALNSLAPRYLGELFRKCSEGSHRILRSTETNLQIPLLRTSTGQKAFSHRGAKLWNELDKETKLASSLATFKNPYERYIIFLTLVLLCSFVHCIIILFNLGFSFFLLHWSICKTVIYY